MTHAELFGNARWVSPSAPCSQPYLRSAFTAFGDEDAEIIITGLGFFTLYCNGKRVSPDLLTPAWTDYESHRFPEDGALSCETRGHRVLAMRYRLTGLLRPGKNVLGILLASGWYEYFQYGTVKACFRLTLTGEGRDALFFSGGEMRWAPSPILQSQMLKGEVHDYALEIPGWADPDFDDSAWAAVREVPAPESSFYIQECPADRAVRCIEPRLLRDEGGRRLYDAGENIAGYAVLCCPEGASGEAAVFYAEELGQDGWLDFGTYCDEMDVDSRQQDRYLLDGKARELFPRFLWHGFRYFTVSGNALPARVAVANANVAVTSSFTSSSPDLNWLYDAYIRTQLANMHAGIPSDCPQREGQGYTGDGQLTCETAMTTLDARAFYEKWMEDISDCQCRETGHVQNTAPYTPCGGGPGGWGCAIIAVPYAFYRHYGDASVLRRYYPQMRRYLDYLESHSDDDLVTRDDPPDAWCLGDWCTPDEIAIPAPFVNTYFYVKSLLRMQEIARILGRPEDIPGYRAREEKKRAALVRAYFDPDTGSFAGGIQGADAFAADIGLGDGRTFRNLVAKYQASGMYDTGIFGTDILTRLLFERGRASLAYRLLTSRKEISFHTIRMKGATTLWEYWTGQASHSHPMFGAVVRYLFQYLLGIRQPADGAGFGRLLIAPALPDGLDSASGCVAIPQGKVSVSWVKTADGPVFQLEVPAGVRAEFRYGKEVLPLRPGRTEVFGRP